MENETNPDAIIEQEKTNEPVVESQEVLVETPKEEKPVETPEARKARLERQLKKVNKELGVEEEKAEPKPKKVVEEKSDEVDLAQLAFHNSKSDSTKIETDDDVEFLRTTMEDTGKSQKDILGAKWFKAELLERSEVKVVKDATPSSKRSDGGSKNNVAFWSAKGELPPDTAENVKLREEVVDAMMAKDASHKYSAYPTLKV